MYDSWLLSRPATVRLLICLVRRKLMKAVQLWSANDGEKSICVLGLNRICGLKDIAISWADSLFPWWNVILLIWSSEYLRRPCFLASPGQHQLKYHLCMIHESLSSMRKFFNDMCHLNVDIGQIMLMLHRNQRHVHGYHFRRVTWQIFVDIGLVMALTTMGVHQNSKLDLILQIYVVIFTKKPFGMPCFMALFVQGIFFY